MSDYIWNYQHCTDFLTNYEAFKRMIYDSRGNTYDDETAYKDQSTDTYYNAVFSAQNNGRSGSKGHEDQDDACVRQDLRRRNRDKMECSPFDELERLSSSFIRLLDEVRKEHGHSRNSTDQSRIRQCTQQQPIDRYQTNICEPRSNSADNQSLQSSNLLTDIARNTDGNTTPQSPESMSIDSTTTRIVQVDSILNDLRDEGYLDDDVSAITPSLVDSSPSVEGILNNIRYEDYLDDDMLAISPPIVDVSLSNHVRSGDVLFAEEDAFHWVKPTKMEHTVKHLGKDRERKNNHNMIERRRRHNISDRINELGLLLPHTFNTKLRQNKGSVLKASIEYIQQLKQDKDRFDKLEEKLKENELHYMKLMSRMQKLEILVKTECLSIVSPNAFNGLYNDTVSGANTETASTKTESVTGIAKSTLYDYI